MADKFDKQPADVQDYDADFTDYILSQGEAVDDEHEIDEVSVDDDDLTVDSSAIYNGASLTNYETGVTRASTFVKVWISGGTAGGSYKVTVRINTAGGRTKEHEFQVKVKER